MTPTFEPAQYTTADGSLVGVVNGQNDQFSFDPYPATFLYNTQGVTGALVFRNGLLIDEYGDYTLYPGYIALTQLSTNDTITVEFYLSGGPSKMQLATGGLTAFGTQSLRVTGADLAVYSTVTFMLFRNGQLLTLGPDYTMAGNWISLAAGQAIQPGDTYMAVIGTGGSPCSTYDGSISGTINGSNATFTLPAAFSAILLFRNGQLLTRGQDYYLQGSNQVVLLGAEIPQVGDTVTAQIFSSGGPVQVTNIDGTLYTATAVESLLFRNGLLMTQPVDGTTAGNAAALAPLQTPIAGDVVTVRAWTPNVLDPEMLPLNLPQQFAISGTFNGANPTFTVATNALVTQIQLFWNGLLMTQGTDYYFVCIENQSCGPWVTTITMLNGQFPNAGDNLTAQVYFS